jgi:glycosyltransferase involved in cell wall biosynthesis
MVAISLIIPTWNNCARLAVTLDAIAQCPVPPGLAWELLLVANNCTDRTREVAARFVGRLPLICLEEPRQGASNARNRGLADAKGELILFADDDVRPCPDWIALYWKAFQVHGPRHYFVGPLRCEFEDDQPPEDELMRVAPLAVRGLALDLTGCVAAETPVLLEGNWACPAEALRRTGGFDPNLGLNGPKPRRVGEGPDLRDRLRRSGLSGIYVSEAYVIHFVPQSKCTLRHAASNWRAHGVYSLHANTPNYWIETTPWLKARFGDEKWTTRACVRAWSTSLAAAIRWWRARVAGRKAYQEYVDLQFCLGRLRGYFEHLRARMKAARA